MRCPTEKFAKKTWREHTSNGGLLRKLEVKIHLHIESERDS